MRDYIGENENIMDTDRLVRKGLHFYEIRDRKPGERAGFDDESRAKGAATKRANRDRLEEVEELLTGPLSTGERDELIKEKYELRNGNREEYWRMSPGAARTMAGQIDDLSMVVRASGDSEVRHVFWTNTLTSDVDDCRPDSLWRAEWEGYAKRESECDRHGDWVHLTVLNLEWWWEQIDEYLRRVQQRWRDTVKAGAHTEECCPIQYFVGVELQKRGAFHFNTVALACEHLAGEVYGECDWWRTVVGRLGPPGRKLGYVVKPQVGVIDTLEKALGYAAKEVGKSAQKSASMWKEFYGVENPEMKTWSKYKGRKAGREWMQAKRDVTGADYGQKYQYKFCKHPALYAGQAMATMVGNAKGLRRSQKRFIEPEIDRRLRHLETLFAERYRGTCCDGFHEAARTLINIAVAEVDARRKLAMRVSHRGRPPGDSVGLPPRELG